jgi:predicted transcriptional regulator
LAFADPLQYILIVAFIVVLLIIAVIVRDQRRKSNRQLVLSIIRAKDGATIDDIIVQARLSPESATNYVNELISNHVVKIQDKDGKTFYTTA